VAPEGKPAGATYIGLDSRQGKKAIERNFSGARFRAKRWATVAALFELRKMLLALGQP
jgi:nicotinamide mononucleotide (NMN) deamidase PncC